MRTVTVTPDELRVFISVDTFCMMERMVVETKYKCQWLTITQASAQSGYSYAQLSRAIREGLLPVHSLGNAAQGGYLVHPKDLEEFVGDE